MKRKFIGEGSLVLEGSRLRARLIREGMSRNRNRWTRAVLDQIASMSEGVPVHMYDMSSSGDGSHLNHWAALREKLPPMIRRLLPETLPGSQVGVVRNPTVVVEQDGRATVFADIETTAEAAGWFPQLVQRVLRAGRSLGISIHSESSGAPLPEGGFEPQEVRAIPAFDVVTNPSAGGGFVSVLEGLAQQEEPRMKDLLKRLMRHVAEAKRASLKPPEGVETVATLIESHGAFVQEYMKAAGLKYDAATAAVVLESLASIEIGEAEEKKTTTEATDKAKAEAEAKKKAAESEKRKTTEAETGANDRIAKLEERLEKRERATAKRQVEAELKTAQLPAGLADFARGNLTQRIDQGEQLEAEDIAKFVADLKKSLGKDQKGGDGKDTVLEGFGPLAMSLGLTSGDKALAALDGLLNRQRSVKLADGTVIEPFRGIREAYEVLSGDYGCRGMEFYSQHRRVKGALESANLEELPIFRQYRAMRSTLEAVTTATFPLILSDRMHKAALNRYKEMPLNWNLVARAETVTDFKAWRFQKVGEFNDPATVAEGGSYTLYADGSYPAEEEISLTVGKKGQLFNLTWEMLRNDDTQRFQQFPAKFARAFSRLLHKTVWNLLLNNGAIYDTLALAHATHANLTASAFSLSNLKSMRKGMVKQKDIDAQEAGRFVPRRVVCGPTIWDQVYETIYSPNKPSLVGTDSNQAAGTARTTTRDAESTPNILRGEYGLTAHEVLYFEDVDNDQYWLLADPNEADMIIVGFLDGKQEPELFLQDMERVGSFFDNEKLTWKGRHIYQAVVAEYRGMQAGIP